MSTVIQVENLSKQYRLGLVGASTFKEDTQRWWAKIRGKDDPFLKLGAENDRTLKDDAKFVWSLKDINFEVQQGDILGVIGRNGAGKSTLLKILSKVTAPTTGTVKVKGRIASLLEVGTGFHPELTGRENIYLNGAILGMRKHEITRKLEEIIAFAGVERYVDTPVKRYSSGMYVRLAFAVAAHLESEILIIDEVLAVGDVEFQNKCLGKIGDISKGEGRTILFVSHNLDSISRLCNKAILLKNGQLDKHGLTTDVIDSYFNQQFGLFSKFNWNNHIINNNLVLREVYVHNIYFENNNSFEVTDKIGITLEYEILKNSFKIHSAFNFYDKSGINIFDSHENNTSYYYRQEKEIGVYKTTLWIPENFFSEGIVLVGVALLRHDPFEIYYHNKEVLTFNMVEGLKKSPCRGDYVGEMQGLIRPLFNWQSKKI